MKINFNNLFRRLARPDIFFYCGLWMMVLLIIGTVSQKYIGLYQARLKFFSSFVLWFYGLPLPGGRATMGLILISLILKTLYSMPSLKQNKKNFSSFTLHLGVILLLTGAFITGILSQEGYMTLKEGEHSSILSNYHKVELSVESVKAPLTPAGVIKSQTLKAFHEPILVKNQILKGPFPFSLKIQEFMKNATLLLASEEQQLNPPIGAKQNEEANRTQQTQQSRSKIGSASIVSTPDTATTRGLKRKKREKINEENQAGLLFQIITPDNKSSHKLYALFEPIPQVITVQDRQYLLKLRPIRTYLPFSIKLIDFKKDYYPGSHKVRSYQSWVQVLDRGIVQTRLIRMNRPLRYKGYTFYQSSYIEGEGEKDSSVFSVVKNAGRAFPYVSSLIICFGLLIYIFSAFLPSSPLKKKLLFLEPSSAKGEK